MADEPGFPRWIASGFYLLLILLGILFYFGWSLLYNTWDLTQPRNLGVYALTVVMLGFGVTGFLLYRKPRVKPEPPAQ
ncbi:MAG TPA: hypothetical protein VGR51_03165 [Thermoplasmata archaeon]|jgi:hypothetical protein|nr:hypothetical protein [Thermoplasmata archaeon]